MHWRSFEEERTVVFDRIIQKITAALEVSSRAVASNTYETTDFMSARNENLIFFFFFLPPLPGARQQRCTSILAVQFMRAPGSSSKDTENQRGSCLGSSEAKSVVTSQGATGKPILEPENSET